MEKSPLNPHRQNPPLQQTIHPGPKPQKSQPNHRRIPRRIRFLMVTPISPLRGPPTPSKPLKRLSPAHRRLRLLKTL